MNIRTATQNQRVASRHIHALIHDLPVHLHLVYSIITTHMDPKSSKDPESSNAPPLLIAEALGFSPQLLLDDIINIANNAVQDGVNGMEQFLQKWADAREERLGGEWDSTQEVEQGLVAFQTLLEYHTDIAFDFFEAWSLRNIFAIPPNLPVVLPHQQNLDLSSSL